MKGEIKKTQIKKNQIIIAALTVLLGVAGYLNFSGRDLDLSKKTTMDEPDSPTVEQVYANGEIDETAGEVYVEDIDAEDIDADENITLNSDEQNIGEAVLTSGDVSLSAAAIKLNREQVRSKAKEYYLDIMNSDGMDEAVVQQATDSYLKLISDMEKESEAESMLLAKGFSNVIVSIGEQSVDVAIGGETLSDPVRAQIEDIVCRKTGCTVDQIVITQIEE
ncbi:MAG: SpoIIIAH-like family protein [Lachnospiraceae bacterium]|nr:SpoIIIAH-like family protein [Lachnospiraceae bacterium]